MAESNPERVSSSESEEEEGSISDMPPPDQEPPKLPDLEVIRNRRSQSRTKSLTKSKRKWKNRRFRTLVGLAHPNPKIHGETREQIVHRENKDGKKSTGTESLGYQDLDGLKVCRLLTKSVLGASQKLLAISQNPL